MFAASASLAASSSSTSNTTHGTSRRPAATAADSRFAPGDQAMRAVALLDEQRLQQAVALDRFDRAAWRRIGSSGASMDWTDRTRSRPVEDREASRST